MKLTLDDVLDILALERATDSESIPAQEALDRVARACIAREVPLACHERVQACELQYAELVEQAERGQ